MAEHPLRAWDTRGKLLTREESWYGCDEAARNVQRSDGSVNWRAAFYADPGRTKCPSCDRHLWNEGARLECPCGCVFGEELTDG